MPHHDYTEILLGIQDVEIKSAKESERIIELEIEQKRKKYECPACGLPTDRIHDYRNQRVKELPSFGKQIVLNVRKRRYVCPCGKRFYEPNSYLARYQRMTQRTVSDILDRLSDTRSYSTVASEFGISASTVIRLFGHVQHSHPSKLPEVMGIDEFKGNSGGEKFHTILTDLTGKKVVDILKTRREHDLCDYFKNADRSGVKYFVSDMYKPYAEMARIYFPQVTHVIDRYHWIRQMIWAFEAVRKEVQKRFSKQHRIYFKHSKGLLLKRESDLNEDERRQVYIMLDIDPSLSTAYFLKEQLYRVLQLPDPEKQKAALSDWIEEAMESEIPSFVRCAKTYSSWFVPITNSFACPYTNGFTEGCNNKIKVLKRNAFGLRNFKRFRNRILFVFSARPSGAGA